MKRTFLASLFSALLISFASAEDAKINVGGFDFTLADPMKEAPVTGMMTKAIVTHPASTADGKPLEIKFFYFGAGQGGGVEANIQRWTGQFEGEPEVTKEELDFAGTKVYLLTFSGTFLDGPAMGGPKTPRADYQMLAAILEGKDALVFLRAAGPKADTIAAKEAFKKLATSPFPAK